MSGCILDLVPIRLSSSVALDQPITRVPHYPMIRLTHSYTSLQHLPEQKPRNITSAKANHPAGDEVTGILEEAEQHWREVECLRGKRRKRLWQRLTEPNKKNKIRKTSYDRRNLPDFLPEGKVLCIHTAFDTSFTTHDSERVSSCL